MYTYGRRSYKMCPAFRVGTLLSRESNNEFGFFRDMGDICGRCKDSNVRKRPPTKFGFVRRQRDIQTTETVVSPASQVRPTVRNRPEGPLRHPYRRTCQGPRRRLRVETNVVRSFIARARVFHTDDLRPSVRKSEKLICRRTDNRATNENHPKARYAHVFSVLRE